MQDVVRRSTSQLTDEDRTAIATYLKSLPAAPESAPAAPAAALMFQGEAIFVQQCSACHLEPGAGEPRDYPSLAGNSLVLARDPTTVLRLLLRGSQSVAVIDVPIGFSMPGFAALSDNEIAAVATFIRNSWGNRAQPVAARDAARLRAQLVAQGQ
jgi:mono/diheme cytochrome c family protein